jgi:hypothetical protein
VNDFRELLNGRIVQDETVHSRLREANQIGFRFGAGEDDHAQSRPVTVRRTNGSDGIRESRVYQHDVRPKK